MLLIPAAVLAQDPGADSAAVRGRAVSAGRRIDHARLAARCALHDGAEPAEDWARTIRRRRHSAAWPSVPKATRGTSSVCRAVSSSKGTPTRRSHRRDRPRRWRPNFPSAFSARSRARPAAELARSRRRVRRGQRSSADQRLRALLRRDDALPRQPSRSDGGALRAVPQARARGAGAAGGALDHANASETIRALSTPTPNFQIPRLGFGVGSWCLGVGR